jgi:hypothetical protein
MLKTLKFNDREFTTEDLFRLEEIEKNPESDNERFLLTMVDKFFFRIAQLQDDINTLKDTMEQA